MTKHTTRRTLLTAAPALLVAPAAVAAEPESEIMRLFRQWYALRMDQPAEVADAETDNANMEDWLDRLSAIADEMEQQPVRTAAELAARIIAEADLDTWVFGPSAEMFDLCGIQAPEGTEPLRQVPRAV